MDNYITERWRCCNIYLEIDRTIGLANSFARKKLNNTYFKHIIMNNTFLYIAIILISGSIIQSCKKETKEKFSIENRTINVYTTADSTDLRITKTEEHTFSELNQPLETQLCIFVEPDKTFQTFIGIGGAITDASAEVFAKMPADKQDELLNSYFDKDKGIGYTILRTNMNSCDFSSDMYTYVSEGDKELSTFNIDHDRKFKIPLIKKAFAKAPDSKLFISPWSPPAYMKSNKDMLKGGKLLPEFYDTWANYYVKFIESYKTEGINIWGLTIQNEPMATQRWESCIYTAEEERDFLKNHLGPTLYKNGLKDKKVIVWDHNRDLITHRANTILNDQEAAKYVWGVGFHWYEDWTGGEMMFGNVSEVNRIFPDKKLIFTEGCADSFSPEKMQNWANAEKYGKSMIYDFNCGTVAWTDWNIFLDQTGGPNHVGNFCFAPVHGDTGSGQLIYTPSYYYIGHFSKFIKEGAKRLSCVSSRSHLLTTSFMNPDGGIVTIVMNPNDEKLTYYLCVGTSASEVTIKPHAIQTLLY